MKKMVREVVGKEQEKIYRKSKNMINVKLTNKIKIKIGEGGDGRKQKLR